MDGEAADVLPDRIISHQPSAQGTLGLTEKKDYYIVHYMYIRGISAVICCTSIRFIHELKFSFTSIYFYSIYL